MSEENPEPVKSELKETHNTLGYASGSTGPRKSAPWMRILLIVLLVIGGVGLLIFGMCAFALMRS